MFYLEIRRHTMRSKPGKHLSQEGVSLARKIGYSLGTFNKVITSTSTRAYETAIAMGFAVDEQIDQLNDMSQGVLEEIDWKAGFAEFARVIKEGGATAKFARGQAKLWRSIANSLPEEGRALIITHGGFIEAGAVACFPEANHEEWGGNCNFCEGVQITLEGNNYKSINILRVANG